MVDVGWLFAPMHFVFRLSALRVCVLCHVLTRGCHQTKLYSYLLMLTYTHACLHLCRDCISIANVHHLKNVVHIQYCLVYVLTIIIYTHERTRPSALAMHACIVVSRPARCVLNIIMFLAFARIREVRTRVCDKHIHSRSPHRRINIQTRARLSACTQAF